jgi:dTDP-4-dehydrorhamnose reductase
VLRKADVFNMHTLTRVLITGGRGLLGTPTAARFAREGIDVAAPGTGECDVTSTGQVTACIDRHRPELIIHCAAFTKVDDCESNPEVAMRVNAYGAAIVARIAGRRGIRLMHLSTDYVFDGTASRPYREDDTTGPPDRLSIYGRTKLAAEQVVQFEHSHALIVRTAWLFGLDGPCFPRSILAQARSGNALRVVNDQTGSPTFAADLADALFRLSRLEVSGIVHVVNSGTCTWYEFARELLRLSAIKVPISPVSTAEFPRPARRPAWSVLSTEKYRTLTGHTPRDWREAAAAFLAGGA